MPVQALCTVAEAVKLNAFAFSLTLDVGEELAGQVACGQFIHIKCGHSRLLRRPISICNWTDQALMLLVKVVGDGTRELVRCVPGTELDVLSGLGNGFDPARAGDHPVLAGGGIGIAPGGNINYTTGHAIFEATHGTAPKYANLDKVNPGSVILSGEMMFRYLGWNEAADLIITGLENSIKAKTVTYDLARLIEGAKEVKCSEFGSAIIANM